jgi:hypothetical protein
MQLTSQQWQLFLTAVSANGNPNERDLAAATFFRQLRRQYSDGYALLADLESFAKHTAESKYGSVILPIGQKYKGQPLANIPADYLLWAIDNIGHDEPPP